MRRFLAIHLLLVVLMLFGCATIRTYVESKDEPAWIVFVDHTMEPLVETSLYDPQAANFRFAMCQSQPAPTDTSKTRNLSYVDVRDLTLVYPDATAPRVLQRQDPPSTHRWLAEDGRVHGPLMRWGRVTLGDRYDTLELRFTAVLVDGVTGVELERTTMQRSLRRVDEKEPAWHR